MFFQWQCACELSIKFNESTQLHFTAEIYCLIKTHSKWPNWNQKRSEVYFTPIHVNASEILTKNRREIFNRSKITNRFEFNMKNFIWYERKEHYWRRKTPASICFFQASNGNTRTILKYIQEASLNSFHTLFWSFHCWFWSIKCYLVCLWKTETILKNISMMYLY